MSVKCQAYGEDQSRHRRNKSVMEIRDDLKRKQISISIAQGCFYILKTVCCIGYIHARTRIFTHAHIQTRTHTRTHSHARTHTRARTCTHTHLHIHTRMPTNARPAEGDSLVFIFPLAPMLTFTSAVGKLNVRVLWHHHMLLQVISQRYCQVFVKSYNFVFEKIDKEGSPREK